MISKLTSDTIKICCRKERKDSSNTAMTTDIEKMGYVKVFMKQLHRGECIIDPKANDIL